MRQSISIVLCLSILVILTGCSLIFIDPTQPPSTTDVQSTVQASTAPTVNTVPAQDPITYELPLAAITMPAVTESHKADDGTELFTYTYQTVSLALQHNEVSRAVVLDLLSRIDSTYTSAQDILQSAENDYVPGNDWSAYMFMVMYQPMRLDQGILSLAGQEAGYSGTTHPYSISKNVTYNLMTGSVLSFSDIMKEGYDPNLLSQCVIASLAPKSDDLYWDYEEIIKDRFSSHNTAHNWYFSDIGLCFSFSPYDIAPYATGTVTAQIPYEKLDGLLRDAYFPPEKILTRGTVSAELFHDADLDAYSRFYEVILDNGGEGILLHSDGTVLDVRLESGTWSVDGDAFIPSAVVFAAESLSPGDAVIIEAFIPDTLPNLRLRYDSGMEEVCVYISQSGRDGSILLLNNA